MSSAAHLLVATVATAPADARAWHWGPTDRSGFAAMGVGELLVHTFDIASGLNVDWRPPAAHADVVLTRLMPDTPIGDPPTSLLWATGRVAIEDCPASTRGSGAPRTQRRVVPTDLDGYVFGTRPSSLEPKPGARSWTRVSPASACRGTARRRRRARALRWLAAAVLDSS